MKKPSANRRTEKGQSLVELALVFTLLLFLITGIVDLGSLFYTYTALQDTTQEGAIYAAKYPTQPTSTVAAHIKDSASSPINSSSITDISVTCSGAACVTNTTASCQGQKITVTVGYNYHLIMPIIPVFVGQNIPLKARVTSTILSSPDTIEALSLLPTPVACP